MKLRRSLERRDGETEHDPQIPIDAFRGQGTLGPLPSIQRGVHRITEVELPSEVR